MPHPAHAGYTARMTLRRLLAVTALVLVLAACGNKGPLTLNQKADEPPVPAAAPAPEATPQPAPASDTGNDTTTPPAPPQG